MTDPWYLRLPWAQMAVGGAVWGTWYDLNPAGAMYGLQALAPYAALGSAAAATWYWMHVHPKQQTLEDICSHTYISGLTRSGKTGMAILEILKAYRQDRGGAWLSIKGARGVLPYLPAPAVDLVDLLCPTSERPRGLNLLRLYTDSATEREQIADQVTVLFQRQHSAMSTVMAALIRSAATALLEYSQRTQTEVALPDLYRLFYSDSFRRKVLAQCSNHVIAHEIEDAEGAKNKRGFTWEAVVRQLRRPISSEALLVAFSQTGPSTIDVRLNMQHRRWLVIDASDSDLGPEVAAFINQVVASKIQLLTPSRKPGDGLYHVFADECQEYSGDGAAFAKAVALAAEYQVAWCLINQCKGRQLSAGMQGAAELCGNQFYFRQAVNDAPQAVKSLAHFVETEDLIRLPKRTYAGVRRIHGEPVFFRRRKTPELPPSNPERAAAIRAANAGPARQDILRALHASFKPEVIQLWGGTTTTGPSATPAS